MKGHKCGGARISVNVSCECGWRSSDWSGKGARASAYSEWRAHVEKHERERRIGINRDIAHFGAVQPR